MRFAASPILVAVALGLLGPLALDEDEDEVTRSSTESQDEPTGPSQD